MSREVPSESQPNPERNINAPTPYHEIFPNSGRKSKIMKAAGVFMAGWLFVSATTDALHHINTTLVGGSLRAKPRSDAIIASERAAALVSVTKSLQGLSLTDKFAINYLGAKGPEVTIDLTTRGNRGFNRSGDFAQETIGVHGSSCLEGTPFDTASKESRMPRTAIAYPDPLFADLVRVKTLNGLELIFTGADSGLLEPADDFTTSILADSYNNCPTDVAAMIG
jgi:hypothetical protein